MHKVEILRRIINALGIDANTPFVDADVAPDTMVELHAIYLPIEQQRAEISSIFCLLSSSILKGCSK